MLSRCRVLPRLEALPHPRALAGAPRARVFWLCLAAPCLAVPHPTKYAQLCAYLHTVASGVAEQIPLREEVGAFRIPGESKAGVATDITKVARLKSERYERSAHAQERSPICSVGSPGGWLRFNSSELRPKPAARTRLSAGREGHRSQHDGQHCSNDS